MARHARVLPGGTVVDPFDAEDPPALEVFPIGDDGRGVEASTVDVGRDRRVPSWPDVVRAASAAVAALALVAIALFVRDMRDASRRQECLVGAQAFGFSGDQQEYADSLRECGYDVPDPDDAEE